MVSKLKIISLLLLLVFSSCDFISSIKEDENEKGFYDYYEDGDLVRIPLIEPFIVASPDAGKSWFFDVPFGNFLKGLQVSNIRSLYVDGDLIFLYSHLISLPGETAPAWFVFDTKNRISKYYTDYNLFVKDFPAGKQMELINKIFFEFKSTLKVPWR